jgi:hypothetical protein
MTNPFPRVNNNLNKMMNKKSLLRVLPIVGTLVALMILPVSAETIGVTSSAAGNIVPVTMTTNTTVHTSVNGVGLGATLKTSLGTKAVGSANKEIDRRLTALSALSARVNAMVRLSATDKTDLSVQIQAQIAAMNSLQAQIATDVSNDATSSLKSDIQSITKSYRIFALIIPQGDIEAMSDRVLTIVGDFDAVATKLQTRISAAQSSGANVSSAVSALADMNAKTSDASVKAQAAVSETSGLQPDNGVSTVMASNTAALKDARSKLQAAQQDLVAARKDAGSIIKTLEGLKVSASSTTSASATSSR